MVELRNVSAGYGKKTVLRDITLAFPPGQVTAILGPNGCGKSTLLKTVAGLLTPTCGEIIVERPLARHVAYLPQSRRLPEMTVRRLVLHGRFPYLSYPRRYRREDLEAAQNAMERVGLTDLAEEPLANLSGGTRQKAYIAMALAQDTPTILLDEPASFLDIAHQLQLMELCRELAASGRAVVMVLHDLPLALQYADQIALLHRGELLARGAPDEIMSTRKLEEAFGVRIRPVDTPEGRRYVCTV